MTGKTSQTGKTIRETVGFLAIVASLIFVGYQIRQSNIQARAAAYQAIGIATSELFDSWAHDRQSAVYRKDAAALDSTDWRMYLLKMTAFARLGETVLLQHEQGLLPENAMERLGYAGWSTLFENDIDACVWPTIREGVSEEFREFVEEGQDPHQIDCSQFAIPEDMLEK